MRKVVIFGAGDLGRILYSRIKDTQDVLFFCDNYPSPSDQIPVQILPPSVLPEENFDMVYIASVNGLDSIYKQLVNDLKVPPYKINRLWGEANDQPKYCIQPRIRFLEQFAEYVCRRGIKGAAAEVGVFRGDFAAEINRVFFDRTLYLFDTFEGFNERDLKCEKEISDNYGDLENFIANVQDFKGTSVETVLSKLPYPQKCVVKRGFFPDTFDLENEMFAFVNIDADLYSPIKAGLEIFYPIMSKGGVILIHDYYGSTGGVYHAVDEFVEKHNLAAIPIGDYASVAIVKN